MTIIFFMMFTRNFMPLGFFILREKCVALYFSINFRKVEPGGEGQSQFIYLSASNNKRLLPPDCPWQLRVLFQVSQRQCNQERHNFFDVLPQCLYGSEVA